MSSSRTAEPVWRDQAQDILDLLSIFDPGLIDDHGEYWRRVAISIRLTPEDSEIDTAKACIEKLGGSWDEELSIYGDPLAEPLYGELQALLFGLTRDEIEALQQGDFQTQLPFDSDEEAIDEKITHNTEQQSITTLLDEMLKRHIELNPSWQREYVWSNETAQKYIESIMLNIPTPSILLYLKGGTDLGIGDYYTVVDGRQRLETILRFCASKEQLQSLNLSAKRFKTPKPKDDLKGPLKWTNFKSGGRLEKYADRYFAGLEQGMQDAFGSRLIPITKIEGVQPNTLYNIFHRYNTGSAKLNPAEIRNAVYQGEPIHKTLWSLARESQAQSQEVAGTAEEAAAIEQLRLIMGGKGKPKRYSTYDFIGRVMAFTHLNVEPEGQSQAGKPSANVGTNRFFDNFEQIHGDHKKLRSDFIDAYNKVLDWYDIEFCLVKPPTQSKSTQVFHAWAGTIQLATAHKLRLKVEEGLLDEDRIAQHIQDHWCRFAGIDPVERVTYTQEEVGGEGQPPPGIFQLPQNARNFWHSQAQWQKEIEEASVLDK